jgi:hypothetical protein
MYIIPCFFLDVIKVLKCGICFSCVPWLFVRAAVNIVIFITNFDYLIPFFLQNRFVCTNNSAAVTHLATKLRKGFYIFMAALQSEHKFI